VGRTGAAEILAQALWRGAIVQVLVGLQVEVDVVLRPRLEGGLVRGVDVQLRRPGQRCRCRAVCRQRHRQRGRADLGAAWAPLLGLGLRLRLHWRRRRRTGTAP
jgi:hypothetical protein